MTVKELIEKLRQFDENLLVATSGEYYDQYLIKDKDVKIDKYIERNRHLPHKEIDALFIG